MLRILLALAIVATAVGVYALVSWVLRRAERRRAGSLDPTHPADPPPLSGVDLAAQEAYRRRVRERAERQRRSEPEPSLVVFDDGVFGPDESAPGEYFLVVSDAPPRTVVDAVERACDRFMNVDETGREHADADAAIRAGMTDELYTPNYTAPAEITPDGVAGYVDCKGVIVEPMGDTFRRILTEELDRLRAPARVRMRTD